MENKFTERPDHSHYGACSSRLREIDDKSRFRSKYTIISSAAACMFGAWGARINGFSLLTDLFTGRKEFMGHNALDNLGGGFLHIITFILLVLLAYLGRVRNQLKFTHIILLGFYCFTALQSILFIGQRRSDVAAFAIATLGIILYIPSIAEFYDFKHISSAEGYPYFNERFTMQNENNTFTPVHSFENLKTENNSMEYIPKSENTATALDNTKKSSDKNKFMDDILFFNPSADLTYHKHEEKNQEENNSDEDNLNFEK